MAKIHKAVRADDTAKVVQLLDAGADVNERERLTGWSPLHCAVDGSNAELIHLLLDRGADVSIEAARGGTPLHWARDSATALTLLQSGADVNARSKSGRTPLHEAAAMGRPEVARTLIENGADVAASTDAGDTPLSVARMATAGSVGDPQAVIELLEGLGPQALEPGTRRKESRFQAYLDSSVVVQKQIKLDACIRKRDVVGAKTLINEGFGANHNLWNTLAGDADEMMILNQGHVLTILGGSRMAPEHVEIACMLLDAGVDPNARADATLSRDGWTQLWATRPPVAVWVRDIGPASIGDFFVHKETHEPIVHDDEKGLAPMHVAAINNDSRLIDKLAEKGADPDADLLDGETPLHMAALFGSPHAVVALIRAGAEVNARTHYAGETPLAWARRRIAASPNARLGAADAQAVAEILEAHGAT